MLGFIMIFASRSYKRVRLWRAIGSVMLAIPAAAMTYLFLGIRLARAHGLSRFYSWPVGGGVVSDNAVGWSLAFWVAVWSVVLFAVSNLLPTEQPARKVQ
jgi:hypothetical protein